jgi:general secretion pathway protein L
MTPDQHVRSVFVLARRFFHWWGAELAACLPLRLRLDAPMRRSRVLFLGPREFVLGHERGDGGIAIERRVPLSAASGRAASEAHAPVRLRLAAERALRLEIPLPAAALENLDQAIAFQLDRYTPFSPDQVYLARAVGERMTGSDAVPVSVTLVERSVVASAIAHAERSGFTVGSVEVAREAGSGMAADLLQVPELRARSLGQFALTAAAAALLVALASAAAILPFAREAASAAALRQELAAARTKADAVLRLEKSIETRKAEASFLIDRKRARVSAIEILAELTRLAPDDTWVTSATFSGTEVEISGLSGSASDLLGRIDTSPMFHKAEFRSPVTPDPKTGKEHFAIAAQVAHGSAP